MTAPCHLSLVWIRTLQYSLQGIIGYLVFYYWQKSNITPKYKKNWHNIYEHENGWYSYLRIALDLSIKSTLNSFGGIIIYLAASVGMPNAILENSPFITHSGHKKPLHHVHTRQPKHNLLQATKQGGKHPGVTLTADGGSSSSLSLSRPGKQWPAICPSWPFNA